MKGQLHSWPELASGLRSLPDKVMRQRATTVITSGIDADVYVTARINGRPRELTNTPLPLAADPDGNHK